MLEENVIDEVEVHCEEKFNEDWQEGEEERPPDKNVKLMLVPTEPISPQNLLKHLVLGFIVRHSVVDLDGIHHKDVADDGNDELRDPIGVTERKTESNCLLDYFHAEPYTVNLV